MHGGELHWVVLHANPGGIEEESKNLRVGLGGRAGEGVQDAEHQDSADEGVKQVEDPGAHHESKKEELSLRSHESQGTVEGPENGIASASHNIHKEMK